MEDKSSLVTRPCFPGNKYSVEASCAGFPRSGKNVKNSRSGKSGNFEISQGNLNQRTIGPENAHLKPDLGVLSHHEMTLTLNTHTPLLTSQVVCICKVSGLRLQ